MSRSPMNVYTLSEAGKTITFRDWKVAGECGISQGATYNICHRSGLAPKQFESMTLGELQTIDIVAGRELARFAIENMGKSELSQIEYVDGKRVAPEEA